MAAAILVGNAALVADAASPRPHASDLLPKTWPLDLRLLLSRPLSHRLKPLHSSPRRNPLPPFGPKSCHFSSLLLLFYLLPPRPQSLTPVYVAGWKRKRGPRDGVAASSEESEPSLDENENGDEDAAAWQEWQEWQEELNRSVKEMEEMNELQKAAEDLQMQADQEAADSQETEQEKRERVRRELQKVPAYPFSLPFTPSLIRELSPPLL